MGFKCNFITFHKGALSRRSATGTPVVGGAGYCGKAISSGINSPSFVLFSFSSYMIPRVTGLDVRDALTANLILRRYLCCRANVEFNLPNYVVCQLGSAVFLSALVAISALPHSISHVVQVASEIKMVRVPTISIVDAGVQDLPPFGNGANEHPICEAVCEFNDSIVFDSGMLCPFADASAAVKPTAIT